MQKKRNIIKNRIQHPTRETDHIPRGKNLQDIGRQIAKLKGEYEIYNRKFRSHCAAKQFVKLEHNGQGDYR